MIDEKIRPYEWSRVSPDVRVMRVMDGYLTQVKTGESEPPSKPKRPSDRELKNYPEFGERFHEELSEHESQMRDWRPTEWWSQPPVYVPDRPSAGAVEQDTRLELAKMWRAISAVRADVEQLVSGPRRTLVDVARDILRGR